MGMATARDFARTHTCDLAACFHLASVSRFVVGGDGAPLAREAADLAPHSLFQLGRFHLKRAASRALSPSRELSSKVYELSTSGVAEEALHLLEREMGDSGPPRRKEIERLVSYLRANLDGLPDFRERLPRPVEGARGLGAIEGNIDKNIANRF